MSVDGIDVGNKCVLPIKHGGSQFRPEFKITDITGYKQKDEKGKGDAGTSAPTETRTPVAWMSGVNVDASKPGYLLKTGGGSGGQGANGGYSAGAVSTQEIYNLISITALRQSRLRALLLRSLAPRILQQHLKMATQKSYCI